MHIGQEDKKSKPEAMHVLAKLNQEPTPDGTRIDVKGGAHIHFTIKFKYIGSKVNSELNDNLNVKPEP
jgi:hypothetical protein